MCYIVRQGTVLLLGLLLLLPPGLGFAADTVNAPSTALTPPQLEQLLAPIALYPDALLAQVLMASTYPLDIVAAARWAKANPKVQGKDLEAAMQQQTWDPSVTSLTAFPQVLAMMDEKLDWTEQLGNAFLAQPKELMTAVQRLRASAQAQGSLASNEQQVVTSSTAPGTTENIIVIQPAQPDVVYVPAYNPTVVYGPWPYPAYPPAFWYPPGYVASNLLSFGLGVAVGSALWGTPDWRRGGVDIDVNRYSRVNNISAGSIGQFSSRSGIQSWQHDPQRRGNVPYTDNKVAERFQKESRNVSTDQTRAKSREAFRGHTDQAPGNARSLAQTQVGEKKSVAKPSKAPQRDISKSRSEVGKAVKDNKPQITSNKNRPDLPGRSPGKSSAFRDAGPAGKKEIQRGSQSRERSQARAGGGRQSGGGERGGGKRPQRR